ncbi:cardiolipin synthase [Paenibacillus koleovorans]|uniref:cardiolipin synthase n=1 Tax=Paenibacillus koleovorans TaxID=121608 RepID=UPI000FD91AA3|nr:cardiolipin synthase [Paenibacillus koleovorans]
MGWWIAALALIWLQIGFVLAMEGRRPTKAVAWIAVQLPLPVLGLLLYWCIGSPYIQRKWFRTRASQSSSGEEQSFTATVPDPVRDPRLRALLAGIPESQITTGNEVVVLSDASSTYKAIFSAIERARTDVHLLYFIVRDDRIGRELQALLLRKAEEGVSVRFIIDGLCSLKLGRRYVQELRDGGVETYWFLPPISSLLQGRANYRNHRKIVVVDGEVGFTGGINIGDEYLGRGSKFDCWRDTHLQLRGPSVDSLRQTFETDWLFVTGQRLEMSSRRSWPSRPLHSAARTYEAADAGEVVQIIPSGPDAPYDALQLLLFGAFQAAEERVWITTPYFIPDEAVALALKIAARRGVDVRLIIPHQPDTRWVYWATLAHVEEFLQAGVRFYRYGKGFVHAKTALVDRMLGVVGTANVDRRSLFSNFEVTAVLYGAGSLDMLERDFMEDLQVCTELELEFFSSQGKGPKALQSAAQLLSALF